MQHHLTIWVIVAANLVCDSHTWKYNVQQNYRNIGTAVCPLDVVVNDYAEIFQWKSNTLATDFFASQEPVCWDESTKKVVIRKCDRHTGQWLPGNAQIKCASWKKRNKFCPEDLIEIELHGKSKKYFCIKLSNKPHAWDETTCYGSVPLLLESSMGMKVISALKTYLQAKNIKSFWMPVTRPNNHTYEPFVWRLPGEYWGDLFDEDKILETEAKYHALSAETNCLVVGLHNNIPELRMTHCTNEFHSVCFYAEYFVADSGCPQKFKALSYRPNICYGINWEKELFPQDLKSVLMPEYYAKRNMFQIIYEYIEIDDEKYFSIGEFEMNGTKLNVEMNIEEKFQIVAFDRSAPALSVEMLDSRKKVEMILAIDPEMDGLILTVYNRFYIWRIGEEEDNYGIKCFTNSDYDVWKSVKIKKMIWENYRQTKSMFELKLYGDGPGYYWCEAHTIFNFLHVKSEKIIATKDHKGHPFATLFDIHCKMKQCSSPFIALKDFAKEIKKTLEKLKKGNDIFDDLEIHNVRIMNIESIDDKSSTMRVLCHVTVSIKSSGVDNSSEDSSEDDSEENKFGIRHDTDVRIRMLATLKHLISLKYPHFAKTVNSTEYCFPEQFKTTNGEIYQWSSAKRDQSVTTQKLCLKENGLPIIRKCVGDFLHGVFWEEMQTDQISCITNTNEIIITKDLYELDSSKLYKKEPEKAVNNLKELLEENIENLIPADFYYIGRIIQSISKSMFADSRNFANISTDGTNTTTITIDDNATQATMGIFSIFNYLMKVNENIMKLSIKLNSTNVLLDAFENFIDKTSLLEHFDTLHNSNSKLLSSDDKNVDTIDYEDVGVIVKITTKFVIFSINPIIANISGIAIFNAEESNAEQFAKTGFLKGEFKNEFYKFILANQSVDDLLYEPGIQLATYVPETLWDRLDEIALLANRTKAIQPPEKRIVIKIYSNDVLFQEDRDIIEKKVLGKIMSISIPGHDKDLPELLPLIMRTNTDDDSDDNETTQGCGYWNYKTWVSDGLVFLGRSEVYKDLIVCGSTHLTPFAYLIGGSFNFSVDSDIVVITKVHERALDIITLLGCSLSLFGILGIFITAALFQNWRQKASSKVLLQLSAAIALQMVLFCFVNTEEFSLHLISNEIFSSCIALGACLHYSVLVQFCWMAVIAYLQFKRYVQVFGNTRPKRFFVKSSLAGWGLPLVPVIFVLLLDRKSYIPSDSAAEKSICYPTGYSFYFGLVLPIVLVIIANLGIFFIILYNVLRGPDGAIRHTEKRLALSQIRLTVLLFFLLGFTWIFGLLTLMKAGIVFSYLFCLTATLQGFVLFIYFIVLDPVTRRMWCGCFRRTLRLTKDFDSSTSMKETTQTH